MTTRRSKKYILAAAIFFGSGFTNNIEGLDPSYQRLIRACFSVGFNLGKITELHLQGRVTAAIIEARQSCGINDQMWREIQ